MTSNSFEVARQLRQNKVSDELKSSNFKIESLILAQDERWRRA